ncbi:hypothetical protein HMPREF0733_10991 [Rothia dentocariosa ATCC 17931]|uniref:Uncharacterized protein n=1 Tax=Rothia dentocariosa (strain ATCC 17931 / CDC X599 / XDIA) TaxID=762948 RepID=E3H3I6_ROTDC|nr:hypothetical protein HMPREF0733_10991 [Rothia dentocariosa ATCC 17931]
MSRFLHKKALYSNKDGENPLYWNKEPFYDPGQYTPKHGWLWERERKEPLREGR